MSDVLAQADCPKCGGSGFVVAPDGGAGVARRCDCGRDLLLPRLLENARIPERYRECTLENFRVTTGIDQAERDCLFQAKELAKKYVDQFLRPTGEFQQAGLIFMGPVGSGKTHLAAAVLSALIRRYRVRGRFVEFTALINQIQSTFDPSSPESKHDVLDPVIEAEVLVLDELGAQKPTDFVHDTLYLVLNSRYSARRPTIFTSNLRFEVPKDSGLVDANLLSGKLRSEIVSRLYEIAAPISLDVADYRKVIWRESLPAKVWGA